MKKILFILLALVVLWGCEEDNPVEEQLKKDIEKIETYLEENNLTAESTSSGLYYIIDNLGVGDTPDIYSQVKVQYTGYLLDGTVFDDGVTTNYLTVYIEGWKEGIPFFKEGGKGTLLIPSKLGYGSIPKNNIPANSVLIFDIVLVDVGK